MTPDDVHGVLDRAARLVGLRGIVIGRAVEHAGVAGCRDVPQAGARPVSALVSPSRAPSPAVAR